MAKVNSVLKCSQCGNIFYSLYDGGGPISCCGQLVTLMEPNTVDAAQEKHVPVIEKIPGGYKVSVGSVPHPMETKHYIMWIELLTDQCSLRKFLKPGDEPVAEFTTNATAVTAREYCNLHGLWKAST